MMTSYYVYDVVGGIFTCLFSEKLADSVKIRYVINLNRFTQAHMDALTAKPLLEGANRRGATCYPAGRRYYPKSLHNGNAEERIGRHLLTDLCL